MKCTLGVDIEDITVLNEHRGEMSPRGDAECQAVRLMRCCHIVVENCDQGPIRDDRDDRDRNDLSV
jgi:hypothetical protein